MSSTTAGQNRIATAIRATTWWATGAAPADFTQGAASTSWPAAVINAETAAAWPLAYRSAMYAQVVNSIEQTLDQVRRSTALSPSGRADSLTYGQSLLRTYEPFARTGALAA